jgi:hypothetical protein
LNAGARAVDRMAAPIEHSRQSGGQERIIFDDENSHDFP